MRIVVRPGMLAALLVGLSGCATTIVPPRPVDEPASVFVVDHGYTATLVLPDAYGTVRYAYGDWAYYGRANRGVLQAAVALFWPTRATLGRKQLSAEPVEADIRSRVGVRVEAMHEVVVERARARALADRLDAYFQAHADQMVVNPPAELRFVPAEPRYHLLRNSNHAVAHWLEAMGAEVRGVPVGSRWRVVER
ncbi:MAG: DUF2459 domain-containing protein [Phycisphaeraceae bacterium]